MNISRRQFCTAIGCAAFSLAKVPVLFGQDSASTLRVLAYNVYGCHGFPADRPLAKAAVENDQMAERLALELALYQPDLVNFSESPSEQITQQVAEQLGMHHVRFPSAGNWPGTLLSRFKILESRNVPLEDERPADLFTRHWGRAVIELPDESPLIVHSAHLYPAEPERRLREIRAMLDSMQVDFREDRSMLLIGDLNHEPDAEEYRRWRDAGWIDTFAKLHSEPGLTFKSDGLYKRIDYVWARGAIASGIVDSRPLNQGAFRVNEADDQSFALSDHLPQFAEFRLSR